jgi:hypothetical protein
MEIPVFRNGRWIAYSIPSDGQLYWNTNVQFQAASLYATALSKGHTPSQSAILAEMFANKQLYPGIQYSKSIESQLDSLFV